MKLLELYAGSRSIGKAAEEQGIEVFSTDIEDFGGMDYVGDILTAPYQSWGRFDAVWASVVCTSHSIAGISHHWNKGGARHWEPKSDTARLGMLLVHKTLEIIDYQRAQNPDLVFFIENPVGGLRNHPIMSTRNMIRRTVTYCQYGDTRMKPTDIWTNSEKWIPRPRCYNGDECHEAAPRGSKTGTQGRKGSFERSKIPHDLCSEIVQSLIIS